MREAGYIPTSEIQQQEERLYGDEILLKKIESVEQIQRIDGKTLSSHLERIEALEKQRVKEEKLYENEVLFNRVQSLDTQQHLDRESLRQHNRILQEFERTQHLLKSRINAHVDRIEEVERRTEYLLNRFAEVMMVGTGVKEPDDFMPLDVPGDEEQAGPPARGFRRFDLWHSTDRSGYLMGKGVELPNGSIIFMQDDVPVQYMDETDLIEHYGQCDHVVVQWIDPPTI